ncbi:hypothetical protein DLH72_01145, partial [Candidatus Gracilibacteria bacterium]
VAKILLFSIFLNSFIIDNKIVSADEENSVKNINIEAPLEKIYFKEKNGQKIFIDEHNQEIDISNINIGKLKSLNYTGTELENAEYKIISNLGLKLNENKEIIFSDFSKFEDYDYMDYGSNTVTIVANNGNSGKYVKIFNLIKNLNGSFEEDGVFYNKYYYSLYYPEYSWDTPNVYGDIVFNPSISIKNPNESTWDNIENFYGKAVNFGEIFELSEENLELGNRGNTNINAWDYITVDDLIKAGAVSGNIIDINSSTITFPKVGEYSIDFRFSQIIDGGVYHSYHDPYGYGTGLGSDNINIIVLPKIDIKTKDSCFKNPDDSNGYIIAELLFEGLDEEVYFYDLSDDTKSKGYKLVGNKIYVENLENNIKENIEVLLFDKKNFQSPYLSEYSIKARKTFQNINIEKCKEKGKIITKFIDKETNEEISEQQVEELEIGENYTTTAKTIQGYILDESQGDIAGILTKELVVVIYKYSKIAVIENGEVEVRHIDINGNNIYKTQLIKLPVGEEYNTSPIKIDGYLLVSNPNNAKGLITKEKIIVTYIYKKEEKSVGNPPIIPEIPTDTRITVGGDPEIKLSIPPVKENIDIIIPKIEEPKNNIPVPPVEEKDNKILSSNKEKIKKGRTVIKRMPPRLPKTGALDLEVIKKAGLAGAEFRKNVDIKLPKDAFKLAGSKEINLNYWLQVVPEIDRNKDKFIVLPKQGLVMPINTVSEKDDAFKRFTNGENEDFHEYLRDGGIEIPSSPDDFGEAGNKVIAGHSSYWMNGKSRYKTHFQKIIKMNKDDEIWIYKKLESGLFQRFVYRVTESYNTDDEDTSILNVSDEPILTLFTCTPIGGVSGRWVVKSKFVGN